MENFEILNTDALSGLRSLKDNSIQVTVTSPPYFNLRKYSGENPLEVGRERTVDQYIKNLLEIFTVLKNKTRDDGLLFLNVGDSYLKGHLGGVPWRLAIALADSGWILRSDIIWHKPNAMPSSIKNRPTTDHEYVFMFAKNPQYFYDQDAIREPHVTFTENSKMRGGRGHLGKRGGTPENGKTPEIQICTMLGGIRHFIH
ncbi:MAG: site-specific DNA-methyltransferase [Corynebacterium sp.]|uniref:DNA-methyltransferase n=1 Tax=Corynebacterium sp. TaxID=1720 RepID=UPI0026DBA796|nr:site-specific DNA-methyltransferase [Corynebacterium sp.]MDO4761603.1 site-specific DNA-methyltransferase [Corynebacterium sp.]